MIKKNQYGHGIQNGSLIYIKCPARRFNGKKGPMYNSVKKDIIPGMQQILSGYIF